MYSIKARHIIGQYCITFNTNLDGLQEFLDRKSTMTEFGALADIDDSEDVKLAGEKKKGDDFFLRFTFRFSRASQQITLSNFKISLHSLFSTIFKRSEFTKIRVWGSMWLSRDISCRERICDIHWRRRFDLF